MSEAAFNIASRHFGATVSRPEKKEVPIELLNLPKKEDIIRKQESAVIDVKAATKKVEELAKEVKEPVLETVAPKKKKTYKSTKK